MEASLLVFAVRALLVTIPLAYLLHFWFTKRRPFVNAVDKIPGPFAFPLIGNAYLGFKSTVEMFQLMRTIHTKFGFVYRVWALNQPYVFVQRPRDIEMLIQSSLHNNKGDSYTYLHPWLGQGLLTSSGEKWRLHRKVLTPAFHFNILHEFLPIFNKHALKMTQCLAVEADTGKQFNIFKYSSLCSLDIICESSMGTKINAQSNTESKYVHAVERMLHCFVHRTTTPWIRPEILFNLTPTKQEQDRQLRYLNEFTDQVIADRRLYLKSMKRQDDQDKSEDKIGGRRSLAFLDLLLAAEEEGSEHMTQKDIRDQVSTFMFEGHDTVSTAMCWALFLLGIYPEHQARVVEELVSVFGDSGRAPDMSDLANLKYLERCIKESMRLYPSVSVFERKLQQDAKIENFTIPAGCTVLNNVFMLHRDPEFWPDPEKFDPDRFLPENTQGRHPYAYLPFSAGPRNCIGQKFALMEEKVVVSTILRRFRVEAAHSLEDVILQVAVVLRPKNLLHLRLYERNDLPKLRVSHSTEE